MKLLALASLAVLLLQAPASLQQQRPQASIEGTVTRSGTGQPLANARVTLTSRGGPGSGLVSAGARGGASASSTSVLTDDKGKFAFSGLDAGSYTLLVQANGYVLRYYGPQSSNDSGAPVSLAANQALRDANVALVPAASISGRIHDSSDQPLINVPVQLLLSSYDSNGWHTYQSMGVTQTNDRGEYRMYWVTPGRYYLLAGRPTTGNNLIEMLMLASLGGTSPSGNEVPAVLGYAFYPGVTEIGNAQTIELQPGADAQAIDVMLPTKLRSYSIRGKLIDSRTGQPPRRANVFAVTKTPGLRSNERAILGAGGPSPNYNPATGAIEIRDLLPGTYSIVAAVQDPPSPGRGGPPTQLSGILPVTISSADVEGLVLSVVPGATIPGRLRIEGQLSGATTIDRMRVMLAPIGENSAIQRTPQTPGIYQTNVSADGTFGLNNVMPGEYRVEVAATPQRIAFAGGFLKEARFEGVDILNTPLRFSGTPSGGLELVVAAGGGKLSGAVTDSRSQPFPGAQVVLVPDRARFRADLFRIATTNASGQFTLSSIAPGDYRIFAWEAIAANGWFDPDFILRSEARGRAVHVTETSNDAVDVRLISAEGRQ